MVGNKGRLFFDEKNEGEGIMISKKYKKILGILLAAMLVFTFRKLHL